MIVAGQVQHAVQHQDFNFIGQAVAQPQSILAGNLETDGYVSSLLPGKRKHVCGLVFVAEAPVQSLHFEPRGDQHRNVTFDPSHGLRAPCETLQRYRINGIRFCIFSIDDNHRFSKTNREG